jgi:hypothetical protein
VVAISSSCYPVNTDVLSVPFNHGFGTMPWLFCDDDSCLAVLEYLDTLLHSLLWRYTGTNSSHIARVILSNYRTLPSFGTCDKCLGSGLVGHGVWTVAVKYVATAHGKCCRTFLVSCTWNRFEIQSSCIIAPIYSPLLLHAASESLGAEIPYVISKVFPR